MRDDGLEQGRDEVLLIAPPFTDSNGPYASVTHLAGYLCRAGVRTCCADLGIEVLDRLLSAEGIRRLAAYAPGAVSDWERYIHAIGPAMRYLRREDPTLAMLLARPGWLPGAPQAPAAGPDGEVGHARRHVTNASWAVEDTAKLAASAFVRHVADLFRHLNDERFSLTGFGETVIAKSPTFVHAAGLLRAHRSIVTQAIEEATIRLLDTRRPAVVGISVPFAGALCGAIEAATVIRRRSPDTVIALGGGYVNTELRDIDDVTAFQFFDYITLDDGYEPLLAIVNRKRRGGPTVTPDLERTFCLVGGQVQWNAGKGAHTPHAQTGPPTHQGLDLGKYFPVLDIPNPVHRLWGDWRWNKLIMAQGCYWRKCAFCDVHLDYVGRYERAPAQVVADWMEHMIAETGSTGFHFVDEAMPPAMMRKLSEELVRRSLCASWWGNVRFERSYSPELVDLVARAGCVAVTGGLEVPSNRLLTGMAKGITVEGAARVMHRFADRGLLVHAYLMYGYPGETLQETVDGLELVRQLFEAGALQGAHWHQFSLTRHSPLGRQARAGRRAVARPQPR